MHQEVTPPNATEADPNVQVPEWTTREMKACVEAIAPGVTASSHAFQYNLGANEQGAVVDVKLHDSTLREPSLEACFARALSAMRVPNDALWLRSSKPFSGGESLSSSRADTGFVQALAAPIALLPIVLVASGLTILVGVTIYVASEALKERQRCKEVLAFCIAKCTEEAIPSGSLSGDPFFKCRRQCLEAANCWGVKLY